MARPEDAARRRFAASQSCGSGDLLAKFFEARANARVHHEVADLEDQAAEHVGIDLRVELDVAPGLFLDLLADVLLEVLVELDRARDRDGQELVLLGPQAVELATDAEEQRHAVPLREQLEEAHEVLVAAVDDAPDPVLLLLRREV